MESAPWIPQFGIGYKLGIDGINIWMLILTTLMFPIALFMSIYGAIGFIIWKFYQALVRIGRELAEIKEVLRAGRS